MARLEKLQTQNTLSINGSPLLFDKVLKEDLRRLQ